MLAGAAVVGPAASRRGGLVPRELIDRRDVAAIAEALALEQSVEVAASVVRDDFVREEVMGRVAGIARIDEGLHLCLVDARHADVHAHADAEAAAHARSEVHFGGDRGFARQGGLLLAGDELHRAEEAG